MSGHPTAPPGPPPAAPAAVAPPGDELNTPKRFYQKVWFWVLVVIVVVAVILAVALPANSDLSSTHTISYTVTSYGDTANSITYRVNGNTTSGQVQLKNQPLPWTKTFTGKSDFADYTLVAQANEFASAITCQITIDGVVKDSQTADGIVKDTPTADGGFAVVSCRWSGSATTPSGRGPADRL